MNKTFAFFVKMAKKAEGLAKDSGLPTEVLEEVIKFLEKREIPVQNRFDQFRLMTRLLTLGISPEAAFRASNQKSVTGIHQSLDLCLGCVYIYNLEGALKAFRRYADLFKGRGEEIKTLSKKTAAHSFKQEAQKKVAA